jgi:hypothetical protein
MSIRVLSHTALGKVGHMAIEVRSDDCDGVRFCTYLQAIIKRLPGGYCSIEVQDPYNVQKMSRSDYRVFRQAKEDAMAAIEYALGRTGFWG